MKGFYRILCPALLLFTATATAQVGYQDAFRPDHTFSVPQPEEDDDSDSQFWLGEFDINGKSRVQQRMEWFYNLRAYPYANVPPNSIHRAWLEAQRLPTVDPRPAAAGNGPHPRSNPVWQAWGPNSDDFLWAARVNAVVVHPANPQILYIGESQGGLFKSTDAGNTWTNLTDNLSSQTTGCIALDPVKPDTTIYFGTGETWAKLDALKAVGIWKTTDGGATWTLYGNSVFAGHNVNHIAIDPTNTNHWIVSCDTGLYVTTDGGATFTQKLAGLVWTVKMSPANASLLYAIVGNYSASTGDPANNGLYKSTDGGNTWTRQTMNGLPTGASIGRSEIDFCKGTPNTIYLAFGSRSTGGLLSVWKSADGGASWGAKTVPNVGAQVTYSFFLRADPGNPNSAYIGMFDVVSTSDGGNTWSAAMYPGNHEDEHCMDFDPTNSQNTYIGNDGGLFYNFLNRPNIGRNAMEFYGLDVHPTDPNKLVAGAQDNGPHLRTTDNNYTRINQIGFDGEVGAYNYANPNIILASAYSGGQPVVYATTDGGLGTNDWTPVFQANGSTDGAYPNAPIINDHNTPNRFYFGTARVMRSDNNGAAGSWNAVSDYISPGTSVILSIAVAPSTSNTVYVGCFDGTISVSNNANTASPTWTTVSAGLPNRVATGLAVDPITPTTVYAGFGGFGSPHVYKSVNGGTTWTNITGNLPDMPVNSLVVDPTNRSVLYAATEIGVFVTSDGANWAKYGTGLPTIECMMLRANAATNYLTVATYGRGIWRIPLGGAATVTPPTASLAGADLSFNGTNQDIVVPSFAQSAPTTEVTIEFWQKVNAAQNQAAFGIGDYTSSTNRISCHTPWSDGSVYFDFGSLSTNGRLVYTPPANIIGSWQHFAFVASQAGNYMRIFRNGVLEAQKTGMTPFTQSAQPMHIGSGNGLIDFFNGQIDEFRVWNRARSSAEITADMNATLLGNEPNLLAYYRFDEGSGTTTADATGHGYAGTLENTPTWLASSAPIDTVHVLNGGSRAITLRAFNPTTNPLTYSVVTNPGQGTLTGTPPNLTYSPSAVFSGYDTFTYKANNGADSNTATVKITYGAPLTTVSGKVTLQNYNTNAQPITFQFRPPNGGPAFSFVQTPAADGTYTISNVPAGTYSLWVKGSKWLAQSQSIGVGFTGLTGINFTLPGGDADNSNVVDIGDFGIMVNAYNGQQSVPGSGYDFRADFNGDGVIDIGDFGILVNSYNQSGDL